jgi:hypothetical protein
MGLGSNSCFVTGTPYLNGGHNCGFDSSVGDPRSDSVGLLVYDSIFVHNQGIGVVLQVPRDSANPIGKGLIS